MPARGFNAGGPVAVATGHTRRAFDAVADVYLPVAVVVFVAVAGILVVAVVRGRGGPPGERRGAPRLEGTYVVVLAVVAAGLAVRTLTATSAANPVSPGSTAGGRPVATIRVIAAQWNWRFDYGGGVEQAGDGRTATAQLVVPANRPVQLQLTSADVVHAFWIPVLRAKYDAMPGYTNTFDLRFAPGLDYSTARCSEFCGTYHDQMRFRVRVLAPRAFDAWLAARRRAVAA